MPQFFINRPVFAWVIAIFITLAGIIAVPQLPMARFPPIAPPSVSISTSYTGASPQTISDSVIAPIERELSGVKNVLYFDSSADTSGSASINVVFKPGTDPTLAQVDVQNRLKGVEALLPETVRRSGLSVEAASSGFLMIVTLSSSDAAQDPLAVLKRLPDEYRAAAHPLRLDKSGRYLVMPTLNAGRGDIAWPLPGSRVAAPAG